MVVQARTGSNRLPGKVLRPLAGIPMLSRVIIRLRHCKSPNQLVLATSTAGRDDPVAALGENMGVQVFRGSELDVLDRFLRCAEAYSLDHVVRATADNPFVDWEEADRLMDFHLKNDLAYSSSFPEFGSGLPIGVGVEVITRDALERAWRASSQPHHREHVNEYIQERPGEFTQACLTAPPEKQAPTLRLTVDTLDDFSFAERLHELYLADSGQGEPGTQWLIHSASKLA